MKDQENNFEMAQQALQRSWEIHCQAFGPILKPAFEENQQVRIPLIAALNHISRREIQQGMEKLKEIQEFCIYDEDRAAWTFFVGLCFEMAGSRKHMRKWYADSAKYHHRFYLPYLKLAKAAVEDKDFKQAKDYFEIGIACMLQMPENEQDEVILGSSYTNLASCLTMLHQYEAAEMAWKAAQQYTTQPGAPAVAAVLYAAMGDRVQSEAYLKKLEKSHPAMAQQTQIAVQKILDGTHPVFLDK